MRKEVAGLFRLSKMEKDLERIKMAEIQYGIASEEDLISLTTFLKDPAIDRAFIKPLSQRPTSIEERVKEKFEKGYWILAKYDGKIVGCLALIPSKKEEVEISTFAVSPEVRGKGIGSKLISQAEKETPGRFKDCRTLILDSWEGNPAISKLMEKHGFEFRKAFPDPDKRPAGISTVVYDKPVR